MAALGLLPIFPQWFTAAKSSDMQRSSCTALLQQWTLGPNGVVIGVDGHAFGAVVRLVYSHEVVGKLEHVVAQTDNHKLGIPANENHSKLSSAACSV